jgi:hypothetical protein
MSVNKILAKVAVEVLNKDGVSILLSAATQTINFKRPEVVAIAAAKSMAGAVLKAKNIPEDTKEIISRYEHLQLMSRSMLTPRVGRFNTRAKVIQSSITLLSLSTRKARPA